MDVEPSSQLQGVHGRPIIQEAVEAQAEHLFALVNEVASPRLALLLT